MLSQEAASCMTKYSRSGAIMHSTVFFDIDDLQTEVCSSCALYSSLRKTIKLTTSCECFCTADQAIRNTGVTSSSEYRHLWSPFYVVEISKTPCDTCHFQFILDHNYLAPLCKHRHIPEQIKNQTILYLTVRNSETVLSNRSTST